MSDKQAAAQAQGVDVVTEELGILDQIVAKTKLGKDPAGKQRGKDMLQEFIDELVKGSMTISST